MPVGTAVHSAEQRVCGQSVPLSQVNCTVAGLLIRVKVLARMRSQRLLDRVMDRVVTHRNRPDVVAAILQQASNSCHSLSSFSFLKHLLWHTDSGCAHVSFVFWVNTHARSCVTDWGKSSQCFAVCCRMNKGSLTTSVRVSLHAHAHPQLNC